MSSEIKFKLKTPEPSGKYLPNDQQSIALNKRMESILAFKRFLSNHKKGFVLVMLTVLALFYYAYLKTRVYKSEVTISFSGFEIPEYDDRSDSHVPEFASMKEGMSRIYNMMYSKQMLDHLIQKFNLYEHYGLNPANANSYATVRKILKGKVSLFQSNSGLLTIEVEDGTSGTLAADMANEIAHQSNEMNQEYISKKMENRIQLYRKLHDEIKSQTTTDLSSLQQSIEQLQKILSTEKMKNLMVDNAAISLGSISQKIESDLTQLIQINKVNSWTANSLEKDMMSNILVLQDALPEEPEMILPIWWLIPLTVFASFLVTLCLFNLVYLYRPYLLILKSRN